MKPKIFVKYLITIRQKRKTITLYSTGFIRLKYQAQLPATKVSKIEKLY